MFALVSLVVMSISTACIWSENSPVASSGTSQPAALPPIPVRSQEIVAKVVRVIDGDTFDVVFSDGSTDSVRLLGVDTPETSAPNRPNEYRGVTDIGCLKKWGVEATGFAVRLIEGRGVTLRLDSLAGERGFYGRLLAYILVEGRDFGSLLLDSGYARVYVEGESSLEKEYLQLEESAQRRKRGLWGCSAATAPQEGTATSDLRYDPAGPDRDCVDFSSWEEAQAFFEGAGGPSVDWHRLDGDNDGIACERLRIGP